LADIGGLPSVLAINVGTYVQTRLMLRGGSVVHRFKATAVANTAVAAVAFKRFVPALITARVLSKPAERKRLATALEARGFLVGATQPVDEPTLRAAILSYQRHRGLLPDGLATQRLLSTLLRDDS
ncbi:MAG: peptidoglycan-binding domain-containing protein, partial [Pseudomonadota bacterium]